MQPARSGVPGGQQRIGERLVLRSFLSLTKGLSKGTNFELGGGVAARFFLWGANNELTKGTDFSSEFLSVPPVPLS
jgi:hypothetical protein